MGQMLNERIIEAGNLYDINKSIIRQLEKELKGKAFHNRITKCIIPFFEKTLKPYKYYMLLCHDKRYYTIFHQTSEINEASAEIAAKEFKEIVRGLGRVFAIEENDGGGIEIWVEWQDDDIVVMYLFECDSCVVEI